MGNILSIEDIRNRISEIVNKYGISDLTNRKLENLLKQLASEKNFWLDRYKQAEQGEELIYEITIDEKSGIALYLVSDSFGIESPPHAHHTWTIIAGICGVEFNRIYTIVNHETRKVSEVKSISIGPGDVVSLTEDVVHSTEVVGLQSTYHLHLYGCSLQSLPSFKDRIFSIDSK